MHTGVSIKFLLKFWAEMSEAWGDITSNIGRLVSKINNFMHLAHLVKQVSVD